MLEFLKYINNNRFAFLVNNYVKKMFTKKYKYYYNHILITSYYAFELAKNQKKDIEIAVIAALLHDFARYKQKWEKKHEYYSALSAEKILKKYKYDSRKLQIIKESILNHKLGKKNYINDQVQIIADADGIAFIKKFDFFKNYEFLCNNNIRLVYQKLNLKIDDIFAKISNEANEMITQDVKKIKKEMRLMIMNDTKSYLGKIVKVKIDRQLGTKHPKWGFVYCLNYGYVPGTISGDGEELDAYVVGEFNPLSEFEGKCIAIIHRTNDDDDKLIIAAEGKNYSDEQIIALTEFQEKYFESIIIRE